MAYETHCKNCGAIDTLEGRVRCDGCGTLIPRDEEGTSSVQVSDRVQHSHGNSRTYCVACTAKVNAALPVWLCVNCGHPRHMHNAGCLVVTGEPDKHTGARIACMCSSFVEPKGSGA